MVLSIERLSAAPGQTLMARDVSWAEFESLLTALGPRRHSRLAYYHRQLEIMAPLPEHEMAKEAISDLIKI
ncbi:MAG: Uma2 family endonuclease, partial [Cyanobacteria bacterium RI_101]|nr:Uma2 family endonuclease [Cyanobacteria bacterium RI_101]